MPTEPQETFRRTVRNAELDLSKSLLLFGSSLITENDIESLTVLRSSYLNLNRAARKRSGICNRFSVANQLPKTGWESPESSRQVHTVFGSVSCGSVALEVIGSLIIQHQFSHTTWREIGLPPKCKLCHAFGLGREPTQHCRGVERSACTLQPFR